MVLRNKMRVSPHGHRIAWSAIIMVGIANFAGYVLDLYEKAWWFDRALHAVTIFALTLWLALFVFHRAIRSQEMATAALLIASVKDDTILDLMMDIVGAMSAGILGMNVLCGAARDGQNEARILPRE